MSVTDLNNDGGRSVDTVRERSYRAITCLKAGAGQLKSVEFGMERTAVNARSDPSKRETNQVQGIESALCPEVTTWT